MPEHVVLSAMLSYLKHNDEWTAVDERYDRVSECILHMPIGLYKVQALHGERSFVFEGADLSNAVMVDSGMCAN